MVPVAFAAFFASSAARYLSVSASSFCSVLSECVLYIIICLFLACFLLRVRGVFIPLNPPLHLARFIHIMVHIMCPSPCSLPMPLRRPCSGPLLLHDLCSCLEMYDSSAYPYAFADPSVSLASNSSPVSPPRSAPLFLSSSKYASSIPSYCVVVGSCLPSHNCRLMPAHLPIDRPLSASF